MNRLEAALLDVAGWLEGQRIPYMAIGGFANLHWGKPRLTEGLDVEVQVEEPAWAEFIGGLKARFRLLAEDPLGLARETHVVPIATPTGVRVDLVPAGMPYEEAATQRARAIELSGRAIRLCTAEDLILHKIVSDRPRDRQDVEGVIARQGPSLDRDYLDPQVEALARGLERKDTVEFYRSCLRLAGLEDARSAARSHGDEATDG